jgi:hypothetical protein
MENLQYVVIEKEMVNGKFMIDILSDAPTSYYEAGKQLKISEQLTGKKLFRWNYERLQREMKFSFNEYKTI